MRLCFLATCLVLSLNVAAASPPPPPPEYFGNVAKTLVGDLTPQSIDVYASLFADDLHVFQDERLIVAGKASWLAQERARLGKVERHVIGYAEGSDTILIVDLFDDRSRLPVGPLYDSRFITRAVRYQFGSDHLIHEIRFLEGGGFWTSATPGR
jgi:hypothetical protein